MLGEQKYDVIYADPPWAYDDKALAGNRGAICKYPVMDVAAICDLPVADMASGNSCLFLWATMPKLAEALAVVAAWDFTYKTVAFTWVKTTSASGALFWGMGRWTRANAELCFLATRGKPKRMSASVHSIVLAPVRAHSQKPPEVRHRIVELCGDVPRIELFARRPIDGWDVWGNQTDMGAEMELAR